jgi:hypothetical protein
MHRQYRLIEPFIRPPRTGRRSRRRAHDSGLTPALAIYGRHEYRAIYCEVHDQMKGLDLWVWLNGQWIRPSSVEMAAREEPARSDPEPRPLAAQPHPSAADAHPRGRRAIDDPATLASAASTVRVALARRNAAAAPGSDYTARRNES